MKSLIEEVNLYHSYSFYSYNYKRIIKKRLDDFLSYLVVETDTPAEDIHLERIYETVNLKGETLFFSSLDVELVEKYFICNIHQSYNWLHQSKRALQSFFFISL